ncbi:hypothetical protein HDV05_001031 [Chytridiales sp. JEL 0842]|nr:hypothetical protein HDV05_001031 [Chytridiales sp. JEL 0842]
MDHDDQDLVRVKQPQQRVCGFKLINFIIAVVTTLAIAGIAIGCGVYFGVVVPKQASDTAAAGNRGLPNVPVPGQGGDTTVANQTITISEVSHSSATNFRRRALNKRQTVSSAVLSSSNPYNYAMVDGLRFKVVAVHFTPKNTTLSVASTTFPLPQTLEIGSNLPVTASNKALSIKGKIPAGNYIKVQVQVQNNFGTITEEFIVNSTSLSPVSIFLESQYTVVCWDGTPHPPPGSSVNFDKPNPFNGYGSNSGIPLSTFYPPQQPHFGILDVPLFVYIGDSPLKVTSQSFLIGPTSASVTGPTIDVSNTFLYSVAYNPQGGGYLGSSARNTRNGTVAPNLEGRWRVESQTNGSFSVYSCGFISATHTIVRNRFIGNISKKAALDGSVAAYAVSDGPDCGSTAFEDGIFGSKSKGCLGSSVDSFWRRVV